MAVGTQKQRIQHELAFAKRTIRGCCAQLRSLQRITTPAMPRLVDEMEADMLEGLQHHANKHGIAGKWNEYLPWEETRHMKKLLKKELP